MRRTIVFPAVLAAAALAVPAASAPAASQATNGCRTHVQPKPGSLAWQQAWSDAWHNAHPGELLPGPQVPGSIGYQRAWAQAWQTAHPGQLLVVVPRKATTARAQQQCR